METVLASQLLRLLFSVSTALLMACISRFALSDIEPFAKLTFRQSFRLYFFLACFLVSVPQ